VHQKNYEVHEKDNAGVRFQLAEGLYRGATPDTPQTFRGA